MKLAGLILAGGRSSRFGREKAAVELGGRPLIGWVLAALQSSCLAVAVSARPESRAWAFAEAAGCPRLVDAPSSPEGPLAGVRAGLAWAQALGADALVTAPCDTPFLPDDLVKTLATDWTPAGGARVCVSTNGVEPLTALWPVDRALNLIDETLACGRHPAVRQVLQELRAVEVLFPDPRAFANLNTPADYAAATSAKFGRAGPE